MPQWLGRHKWLWIVAAVVVALFAFAACDDDDDEGTTPTVGDTPTVTAEETPAAEKVQPTIPLKIGHANSFTGDLADFGDAHNKSSTLAINEINAAGGVGGQPIELVSGDTATDPSQGATEATRLIEVEGVDFLVGALSSGVTLQIAESVTGPNNILHISGASTSPGLTEANDNDFLFRTTISDAAQGVILAKLASEELGLTTVCNMFINNAYGEGLSDSFKENFEALGGTITEAVKHESEQATYASELSTCTGAGPEALAAIAYPESAGVFLREAVEAGDVDTFLFVDGTKSTQMLDDLGWANFDQTRGTAPSALALATGEAFEAAYAAEHGDVPPLPFMRETYDAIYLMALATEKALADDIDIRDALREVANPGGEVVNPGTEGFAAALDLIAAGTDINYEGAAGPVDLDANGDVLVGAIETFTVDAATEDLITNDVFKVDLTTGEVTKVE
jgi:ABC-type branched-subunit amino acid transport system substrate-binding protein